MSLTYDAPAGDGYKTPILLTINPNLNYPFRQDLTAKIYSEQYCQRPDYFTPLALDTPHPVHVNAYLVNETNPRPMGSGGLFKFTRYYATIPATRTEFQTTNFAFPAFKSTSASTSELRGTLTETCVAKVIYSYTLTNDPTNDLVFTPKFQPLDSSSNKVNFVASDTTPTKTAYETKVSAEEYINSQQTKVSRWKGNIWQLQDIKVKAL